MDEIAVGALKPLHYALHWPAGHPVYEFQGSIYLALRIGVVNDPLTANLPTKYFAAVASKGE